MALRGNGKDYDASLKAADSLRTSTVQYLAVGLSEQTAIDFTAGLTNAGTSGSNTITGRSVIGVNQTMMSAGSTELSVRMLGISKAKCAASIPAGAIVSAYDGVSTTTFSGHIQAFSFGTVATATNAQRILGIAMENGSTNTVVTIFVNVAPVRLAT